MTRFRQVALVLLVLIILPVILYSGYEIATLSTTEELIARIYRQQLDLLLISINQHAWDVVNGWVTRASAGAQSVARLVERTPSIRAVCWCDPGLQSATCVPGPDIAGGFLDSLRVRRELVDRLLRYDAQDYRKIEPIQFGGENGRATVLVFVAGSPERKIGGLFLDERQFVTDVLGPKITESAGSEFLVGVFSEGERLFSTGEIGLQEIAQTKDLWVFPRMSVGIRMQGASLDEILRDRLWRNLGLVIGLDLLLLAGGWIVYRGINREIALVRLRSDFVSTVSHELRTPLALIRMYAETLEMGRMEDPVRRKEYLGTILSETERLTRLVNDVLTVSRTDARSRRMEQVDLNQVVREVVRAYEGRLRAAGFAPILDLADPAVPVTADREALAEALINLIDNSMKYSDGEKFLRLATGVEGRRAFVEVEDKGKGIGQEHQKKVFEAFYRVSEGLVHSTRGTGLGLALVKRIMEAHGGEVMLKSAPGKGSTFRLLFRRAVVHD